MERCRVFLGCAKRFHRDRLPHACRAYLDENSAIGAIENPALGGFCFCAHIGISGTRATRRRSAPSQRTHAPAHRRRGFGTHAALLQALDREASAGRGLDAAPISPVRLLKVARGPMRAAARPIFAQVCYGLVRYS